MGKSIAAPRNTSEPEITHPAWCDPDRCEEDRTGGVLRDVEHISSSSTWSGRESLMFEVYATSFDNFDGESEDTPAEGYLVAAGQGPIALGELFDLGARLIRKALDYGYTPASEVL